MAGAPERSARSTIGSSRRRNFCSPNAAKNEAIGISSWSSTSLSVSSTSSSAEDLPAPMNPTKTSAMRRPGERYERQSMRAR